MFSGFNILDILNAEVGRKVVAEVDNHPDSKRSFMEICRAYGFPVMEYGVITDDGYILTIFRIPFGNDDERGSRKVVGMQKKRPVVFLQHGLIDSADTWILNGSNHSPAFLLANSGYDVFLGNSRGNYYSRKHIRLSPKDKAFWDFTWVDMGRKDIPKMVDYALKLSKSAKLTYIGHSQGTTQMFVALSQNSDWWAQRVNCFVALGPVTKTSKTKSKIIQFLAKTKGMKTLSKLGVKEMFPRDYKSGQIFSFVIKQIPQLAHLGLSIIADDDPSLNCRERLSVFTGHFPSGSSLKDFDHFSQTIVLDAFKYYDYGRAKNLEIYDAQVPPDIPLSEIRHIPIGMFVGTKDQLATVEDNKWTKSHIPSELLAFYGEYELGHMTFLLAKDMSYFQDVLTLIRYFNKEKQEIAPQLKDKQQEDEEEEKTQELKE